MSARLLKGGAPAGAAFAPFTIPSQEEVFERAAEGESAALGDAGNREQDVETQARDLLEVARHEADRLLTEAQARVAEIEQEARAQGLAQARAQMDEEVAAAAEDWREKLAQTLNELQSLYALIAARSERDLVRLALEIARKVVHREVTTDSDIVLTLARVALERLHPRAVATVLLHPDDFEYVNTRRPTLSSNSAVEIVADTAVGRGGCIVQSEHGDIDARVEQQFARLERGFFE